jgi:hypothetical protein
LGEILEGGGLKAGRWQYFECKSLLTCIHNIHVSECWGFMVYVVSARPIPLPSSECKMVGKLRAIHALDSSRDMSWVSCVWKLLLLEQCMSVKRNMLICSEQR